MPKLGIEIKRRCGICGKVFIIKTLDSLYCCKKCNKTYEHLKETPSIKSIVTGIKSKMKQLWIWLQASESFSKNNFKECEY